MNVEFHFDIACPFAYFGATQIEALCARTGATLSWHPLLLGGVFKAIGQEVNLFQSFGGAKTRHNLADMVRWADHLGVPFRMNPHHPVRTVNTMRALLAADSPAVAVHSLYRAYWVENLRLDDDAVLEGVLARAGLDGAALVRRTQDADIKDRLRAVTDAAVARGVFGVPAMFVGDELVWGQDRLHFVEHLLTGGTFASP